MRTHRPRPSRRLLAPLVLAAAACVSLDETRPDERPGLAAGELGTMTHVSVFEDVWLGGHASPQDLDIAHRRGIETVVDLGPAPESGEASEVEHVAEELGLRYVRASIDPDEPDPLAVSRVLHELGDPERDALLLLCDDGARCATVFAVHRVLEDGLPLEAALEEARRAGLKPDSGEAVVRWLVGLFAR